MGGDGRQVRRLRATPLLVVAGLIQLGALALFGVNFPAPRTPVAVGWLGAPLATILAAVACWEAGGTRGLDRVATPVPVPR